MSGGHSCLQGLTPTSGRISTIVIYYIFYYSRMNCIRMHECGLHTSSGHQKTSMFQMEGPMLYMHHQRYPGTTFHLLLLEFCKCAELHVSFHKSVPCDQDVYDICKIIMAKSHLAVPRNLYIAIDLYIRLRDVILASM